ncbi:SDR family NAD(P)-dependent oxidoreductase [Cupriavidus sp. 2MCAB6]|uniref:SDR family NAD(P)-dependent oxidoreductase n=1 Tax=Cupriavidus sp. 2MCAB6 TaxID=3232981 RepID=UPI003F91CA77
MRPHTRRDKLDHDRSIASDHHHGHLARARRRSGTGTALLTNLAAPMTMTAAFLAHTERFGCPRKILAISSGAARRPIEGWSAYCAGKAGLDMFVRSINAEYAQAPAERAVRAVALAPGVVDTGMQATIRDADFAQVQRFRDLKENDQLASADDTAQRIAAYLERPDFGSTELDDIRNT